MSSNNRGSFTRLITNKLTTQLQGPEDFFIMQPAILRSELPYIDGGSFTVTNSLVAGQAYTSLQITFGTDIQNPPVLPNEAAIFDLPRNINSISCMALGADDTTIYKVTFIISLIMVVRPLRYPNSICSICCG